MSHSDGDHLSVAKALYQLDFYLRTLDFPVRVTDIYALAYQKRRGDRYDDRWLSCLDENPDVSDCLNEPFTTQTIIETLLRTGHEPIVRALMKEVRRLEIGYTQAYMIGTPRHR